METTNNAAKLSTKQAEVLAKAANHFAGRFSMVSATNRGKGRRWIGPTSSVLALERKGLLTRAPWSLTTCAQRDETAWNITETGRTVAASL